MKRADACLIFALLAVGAVLFFLRGGEKAGIARVYLNGEIAWEHSIAEDGEFSAGGVTVIVKGGKACVAESNCPDKYCVRSGCISKAGESVVCLPNKISLVLSGDDAPDAVIR